jgi:hypothetical protein
MILRKKLSDANIGAAQANYLCIKIKNKHSEHMLPIILGIAAAIAGTSGVALGVTGAVDMANANSRINSAKKRDEANRSRLKRTETSTLRTMDALGTAEINALESLDEFSEFF